MCLDRPNAKETSKAGSHLDVYLLGTVEFDVALGLQRRLAYQVAGERNSGALILCEHPPLITVGRQGSWAHIRFDPAELALRGWPIRWVNRGGGCMLHLPGQLAVYPILPLDRFGLGLREYLCGLKAMVTALLDDFSIRAMPNERLSSVAVGERPIACLGVAVRDWVSYFGLVMNVNPSLDLYRLVRTERDAREPMTSLERERRGPARQALVRERLVEHFQARYPFERVALFSDHPSLQAKAHSHVVPARP